jgi:hypothetical protein
VGALSGGSFLTQKGNAMNNAKGISAGSVLEKASIRKPGVDFDLEGSKSTLTEMLQLGGLFPLARVADRLPFSEKTLRRWARKGPFTDCFVLSSAGSSEEFTPILIHLNFIEERFQALAQQAREEDEKRYLAEVASFLCEAGNLAV